MDTACKKVDPCKASACKPNSAGKANSCQYVKPDGSVCGEPKTFNVEIVDAFNEAYENRLNYIDKEIGNDCAELKYPIYKDWVRDLIAQNKTFIQVLDELEREASHRFELLQAKLDSDQRTLIGGDSQYSKLEGDLKNLLELIHRALETNKWDVACLEFQTITVEDIFGKFLKTNDKELVPPVSPRTMSAGGESEAETCIRNLKAEMKRLTHELNRKDCLLEECQCRIKNLQLDGNLSCESVDSKSELEDRFKSYIDELKHIIKDKDAKNTKLNKENEDLKKVVGPNPKGNASELDKKKALEPTQDKPKTEPSEAQIKPPSVNCNDLDVDKVENVDEVPSDVSVCNRINQEINDLLTQIRARESHISNQNSIICNFQAKLNETRLQLSLITCERDQVCNKLSIIENELGQLKDDINHYPASQDSDCDFDAAGSCSLAEEEPCEIDRLKEENKDHKLRVILNLKPMVNSMRETIVNLNRENCSLKSSLDEFKEILSESQCEVNSLKKRLSELSSKSCADKEVLVKFKCDKKDSLVDAEFHDVRDCCCTMEKINKWQEMCLESFKSILRDFISNFGIEVNENDLERVVNGDKMYIDKLVEYIKEILQTKTDTPREEQNTTVCKLKEVLSVKESEIFDLKCKLTALNIEADNCSQTMQLNEDKMKILCEEKDRLDHECKNQLTTIENLREALELVKRGHSITSVSQPNDQNVQSSSLWGWWRNVHDV